MYYELVHGTFFSYPKDNEPSTIYLFYQEAVDRFSDEGKSIVVYHPDSSKIGRVTGFLPATEIITLNVFMKTEPILS